MALIRDSRGKVPNFIFDQVKMVHQPTGLEVKLISGSDSSLRLAHNALRMLVRDHYTTAQRAFDNKAGAGVQPASPEGS